MTYLSSSPTPLPPQPEIARTSETSLGSKVAQKQPTPQDLKITNLFSRCVSEIKNFFSKVSENSDCKNHSLQQKHAAGKTKSVFKRILNDIKNQFYEKARNLKEGRIIKSFKGMIDSFSDVDFSFVRDKMDPLLKEAYEKEHLNLFEQFTAAIPGTEENQLEAIQKELEEIGKIAFAPTFYPYRNALVAEIIAKDLAALSIPENFTIPFPCFNSHGKPVTIPYHLEKKLLLGESGIPVLLFSALTEEEEEYPPFILFRGTKVNFHKAEDIRSIIENLNSCGPARGVYAEFKKYLGKVFKSWYSDPTHKAKFRIFGYSQGGVLGQRAMADFAEYMQTDWLNSSLFFNSPGVEKEYIEEWSRLPSEKRPAACHFLITNDIISKAGKLFLGDVYELQPVNTSLLNAHFGKRFLESKWELFLVNNARESESPSRNFINQIMASKFVGTVYEYAKKGLEKVLKPRLDNHERKEVYKVMK